eukprot:NODE_2700_length_453_cov_563.462871_g2236_i0.p1 GENE.NODE_2700_length_453_cov_563.462871_g2236_i0~~NODE_2700_length_453_cov_563.462871_g2236_i0.p1  ORF type:complete len:97 (-),score=6.63 NODE_2700_length_453_cov_563.462871_g2236_i0:90-380(-)
MAFPRTDQLLNCLDPVWPDSSVPVLVPAIQDRTFLEREALYLAVFDEEQNACDPVGQAVLPLHKLCDGEKHKFTVPITFLGVSSGHLAGTIQATLM